MFLLFSLDDDDDFGDNESSANLFGSSNGLNKSREEKRRQSHTMAEQKRRNAIKVSGKKITVRKCFIFNEWSICVR